jgi:hypothetical protein
VFYSLDPDADNHIYCCNDCDNRSKYRQARESYIKRRETIEGDARLRHIRAREEFIVATQEIEEDTRCRFRQAQEEFDNFMKAMEEPEKDVESKKANSEKALVPDSASEHVATPNTEPVEDMILKPLAGAYFDLAQEVKYQGFEEEKIKHLLYCIQNSTFKYRCELAAVNEMLRDGRDCDNQINQPLKFWNLIDPSEACLVGKEWFRLKDARGTPFEIQIPSESHAPITAALRRILKVPEGERLTLSSELKELGFSHVYTAFVNWFVFDVINNELDILAVPSMQPLKNMMEAVTNFGDASKFPFSHFLTFSSHFWL